MEVKLGTEVRILRDDIVGRCYHLGARRVVGGYFIHPFGGTLVVGQRALMPRSLSAGWFDTAPPYERAPQL